MKNGNRGCAALLLHAATGVLLLTTAPAAHAQQPDAVAALRRCQGSVANMYKGLPKWPATQDTAVIADYRRIQNAHLDSVRATIKGCLLTISIANIPDSLLDSLSVVQRSGGDEAAAIVSLQRLQASKLPLVRRVDAVWRNIAPLKGNAQVAATWRVLVPMADSLRNVDQSVKIRLGVANAVRSHDPLAAYGPMEELVSYVERLDSAGRTVALSEVFMVAAQLGDWAIEDKGSAGIPLVTRLRVAYPNVTPLAASERRIAHLNKPAPPMESPYWLNAPGKTSEPFNKGRVTLVEFTTAWCSSCKYTYGPIQKMTEELRAKGFDAMFVVPRQYAATGPDASEPPEPVEPIDTVIAKYTKLFQHYNLTFPIMVAETTAYDEHYGVIGPPHMALIDRKGVVRDIWVGWDVDRMEKKLKELLAEH